MTVRLSGSDRPLNLEILIVREFIPFAPGGIQLPFSPLAGFLKFLMFLHLLANPRLLAGLFKPSQCFFERLLFPHNDPWHEPDQPPFPFGYLFFTRAGQYSSTTILA